MLLDGGGSLGALAAGLPMLLQHRTPLTVLASYQVVFFGYSVLCLVVAAIYMSLSSAVEVGSPRTSTSPLTGPSPGSKKLVARITILFSLDAFGGGFLTDALVAYWFFRRFGIAEQDLGVVFLRCIS